MLEMYSLEPHPHKIAWRVVAQPRLITNVHFLVQARVIVLCAQIPLPPARLGHRSQGRSQLVSCVIKNMESNYVSKPYDGSTLHYRTRCTSSVKFVEGPR